MTCAQPSLGFSDCALQTQLRGSKIFTSPKANRNGRRRCRAALRCVDDKSRQGLRVFPNPDQIEAGTVGRQAFGIGSPTEFFLTLETLTPNVRALSREIGSHGLTDDFNCCVLTLSLGRFVSTHLEVRSTQARDLRPWGDRSICLPVRAACRFMPLSIVFHESWPNPAFDNSLMTSFRVILSMILSR